MRWTPHGGVVVGEYGMAEEPDYIDEYLLTLDRKAERLMRDIPVVPHDHWPAPSHPPSRRRPPKAYEVLVSVCMSVTAGALFAGAAEAAKHGGPGGYVFMVVCSGIGLGMLNEVLRMLRG